MKCSIYFKLSMMILKTISYNVSLFKRTFVQIFISIKRTFVQSYLFFKKTYSPLQLFVLERHTNNTHIHTREYVGLVTLIGKTSTKIFLAFARSQFSSLSSLENRKFISCYSRYAAEIFNEEYLYQ